MAAPKKFDTFAGVFTPTLLTILGVIMYLRLGWVVGNAGLLGAWLIIIVAFGITLCTALSMSSITTNIRIGAGGAYAIISQSLGLEVGGSLGIPRYISQGLAVTMYIFGFREGWLSIFPSHSPFIIDVVVFILLYAIAYKSADLAIKTQYFIMGIIILSLITIVFASYYGSMQIPTESAARWGTFRGSEENGFSGTSFWVVFAVFFPAATGIMAGANMSGELINPRQSIPKGTLWAIGVSFLIYMFIAYWIARSASEQELISNYNIIIERSFWPPAMIAGVLGATFSSALASIIGSSRILFAMGENKVLPKGGWLAYQDDLGQPRNAMIVTGILVFVTMLLRDLNAIAPLVTMFFLVTYAMLNVVVIIEQRLGLISFRPIFSVNRYIPWVGLIGSLFAMFIINPTVSLISWALMFAVYFILARADLETPFEDVRSGLFTSFSEWAAKHTAGLTHKQERSWKPNLLVPTTDASSVQGAFAIIKDIAYSKGSATLMGINHNEKEGIQLKNWLMEISESFKKTGVYSSSSLMKTKHFAQGVNFGNQALSSAFFKPNIIFLSLNEEKENIATYPQIIEEAEALEVGVILYAPHPKAQLGQEQNINVWIDDRKGEWDIENGTGNIDLSILIAYKLMQNWQATIRLITVANNESDTVKATTFLSDIVDLARMPITDLIVLHGQLEDLVQSSPKADINIFCLMDPMSVEYYQNMVQASKSTCLFVKDGGHENILA
ncbi:MAG: amino acid permease [Saprospiraceae bacterium]|nr:amino acid permease [Saprospiraceae bacterium]